MKNKADPVCRKTKEEYNQRNQTRKAKKKRARGWRSVVCGLGVGESICPEVDERVKPTGPGPVGRASTISVELMRDKY